MFAAVPKRFREGGEKRRAASPLWARARERARRACARLCGREFRRKPAPVKASAEKRAGMTVKIGPPFSPLRLISSAGAICQRPQLLATNH